MARKTRRPSKQEPQADNPLGDLLGSVLGSGGNEGGLLGNLLENLSSSGEQGSAAKATSRRSTRKRSTTSGTSKKSATSGRKRKSTGGTARKSASEKTAARKKKGSTAKPAARRTTRKSTTRKVQEPATTPEEMVAPPTAIPSGETSQGSTPSGTQPATPSAKEVGLGMLRELLGGTVGLPGNAAQSVLAFLLRKFLAGGGATAKAGIDSGAGQGSGLDLDDVLQHMGGEAQTDRDYLRSTGMPQELAQQTGLDVDRATQSLQEVLSLLRGRKPAGS